MAKSLFAKAKETGKKTTPAKKDEKTRIKVDDEGFFDKIEQLETLQERMKKDKAKADVIHDEVKEISVREWIKLYSSKKKNPESIMLEQEGPGGDIGQVMFIPSDKYLKVSESKAEELREKYGDEIVSEQTTFAFNAEMLEKYGEVISKLIMESEDIDEKDKEKIITATTTYNIAKGTIDSLATYGKVNEVMEDVNPVVMLKNVEVIKS